MAVVKSALKSIAEPLISVGLRTVLSIPVDGAIEWVKQRFTDHSEALPKAIAAANDRAWQALALALAGDSLLDTIFGRFRDSDMKAVRTQIRAFVDNSDSGLELSPAGLRAKACEELNQLKSAGRLGADVEWTALDLTRFGSTAKLSDDAHRAVSQIAAELQTDAPHLFQVLTLAPPGGTPLLATAFAFFLRRQIATNPELACELTHDGLRLLSQKQQAGFENLEHSLESKWGELGEMLSDFLAESQNNQSEIIAKLDRILEQNQVVTKPEAPLRVSVNSESERDLVRQLRDRVRELPTELVGAKLHSLLGDGLAAAGEFADAQQSHAAAAVAAHASADRTAEAEAEYKQFKDACEIQQWEPALAALNRAIALDEKRFRPVPKHYAIESILGAGAFGVVFKCRNTISFDEDDNELIVAVKTFRESDLERPLKEIFGEANTLKNLTHESIIRVLEHGYADPDMQLRPFLAMEYFPGVTLEEYLKQHGKLSIEQFREVFSQIASALHKAHTGKRPVFHRDLKPANIMVRKDGETWIVKVIDFGLAVRSAMRSASMSIPHALRVTRDKSIAGTVKYAAPEQLGEKPYPVGAHSDVFAFGKTALECLFGTVQPTPRHWKLLPDDLAEMLARCIEEDYFPKQPDEGRFHGFEPILVSLAQSVAPATAKPIVKSVPATAVIKPNLPSIASETRPVPPSTTVLVKPAEPIRLFALAKDLDIAASILVTHCKDLGFSSVKNLLSTLDVDQVQALKERIAKTEKTATATAANKNLLIAGDRLEIPLPGGLKMAFAYCPASATREGFYTGIYPVTQAEYQAVIGTNPSKFKGSTLPVENVSWDDAIAFCEKIKSSSGQPIRLPTEAEWEYACRGGTTTEFYFGNALNGTQANCDGNHPDGTTVKGPYLQKTTPVGSYAEKYPHPWGLADVHGNVLEWCTDWYDSEQKCRVVRGGSWDYDPEDCRAAYRDSDAPDLRVSDVGFRVCFSLGR